MADDPTNDELTEKRVRKVLEDRLRNSRPEDYIGVIDNEAEAVEKVEKKSALAKELTKVRLFFSLLKDHSDGVYPDATPGAIVAVGLGLSYLIWPFDVIPDFAPGGVGLVDDAIILALVWLMVRDEVEIYLHWKIRQDPEYKKIQEELYNS